jgi:membrane protein YdbS with pleckstrin-like domain
MPCPTCHAEIPADAAFCPKCGQQIANVAAAPPSGAAVVVPSPADRLRSGQHPVPHEEEKELWHGGYSSKAMFGGWIFAGLITVSAAIAAVLLPNPVTWIAVAVIVVLVWLVPLLKLGAMRLTVEYTLTTQRFLHKKGFVRRVADQILLVDIDDITYEQGPIGRLLNFGTITLRAKDMSLAGKGAAEGNLTLVPVDNVQQVANLIDEARREERRKRAIYMASA